MKGEIPVEPDYIPPTLPNVDQSLRLVQWDMSENDENEIVEHGRNSGLEDGALYSDTDKLDNRRGFIKKIAKKKQSSSEDSDEDLDDQSKIREQPKRNNFNASDDRNARQLHIRYHIPTVEHAHSRTSFKDSNDRDSRRSKPLRFDDSDDDEIFTNRRKRKNDVRSRKLPVDSYEVDDDAFPTWALHHEEAEPVQTCETDPITGKRLHIQILKSQFLQYDSAKTFYDRGLSIFLKYKNSLTESNIEQGTTHSNSARSAKVNAMSKISRKSSNNRNAFSPNSSLTVNQSPRRRRKIRSGNSSGDVTPWNSRERSVIVGRNVSEDEEEYEDDVERREENMNEEYQEEEDNVLNEPVIDVRNVEAFMNNILTRRMDPATEYFGTYSSEIMKILEIIGNKTTTFHDTMQLSLEEYREHWSMERMTREEHDARFTRWDAALAKATLDQTKDEMRLFETNAYVFKKQNEKKHCQTRAMKIERIVNEPLDTDTTVFCYQRFSLLDIAERKQSSMDSRIFNQAIIAFNKAKKQLFSNSVITKEFKNSKVPWTTVKSELERMTEEDYLLPKGKLFCRLVLNVAELFNYDVYHRRWNNWIQGTFETKMIYKGIPFDQDGEALHFDS